MSEYDGSTDIVDSISTRCVVRRLLSSPVSRPRRRRSWTFVSKSFFDLQRNVQLTRMWQLSRCHSRPGWWRHLLLSLSSLPSFIAFVLAARLVGSLALAPPAPRVSDPYEMTRSWSSLVCILMSRISYLRSLVSSIFIIVTSFSGFYLKDKSKMTYLKRAHNHTQSHTRAHSRSHMRTHTHALTRTLTQSHAHTRATRSHMRATRSHMRTLTQPHAQSHAQSHARTLTQSSRAHTRAPHSRSRTRALHYPCCIFVKNKMNSSRRAPYFKQNFIKFLCKHISVHPIAAYTNERNEKQNKIL